MIHNQSFFIVNLINSIASTATNDEIVRRYEKMVCRSEIGSKHCSKLKPESGSKPGSIRKSRPNL